GNVNATIRTLMVLEQRHQPSRGANSAVDCRHWNGTAISSLANSESTRLKRRAVRCRCHFHPPLLAWQPRLAVVAARRAQAQVACRRVDHPVRQAKGLQHRLLQLEEAFVLSYGIVLAAKGEQLDLVELVH